MNDLERLKYSIIKIRIMESKLLSPEFDYLEIDEKGLLVNSYPVLGSLAVTRDKVQAASIINGLDKMTENKDKGWIPYFEGVNEIYSRVNREMPYKEHDFIKELMRIEGLNKKR